MGEFNVDIYDEMRCIVSKMAQAHTFRDIQDLEKEFHELIKEYRKLQFKRLLTDINEQRRINND